ncbi:methyltransferase domain-containing protein [bacterium]|nr:methyltransferase domain-containing protein [bacterium]
MPVDLKLLHILACPDCHGKLSATETGLVCGSCSRSFDLHEGIPLLYPRELDIGHFREETLLAEMMLQSGSEKRSGFNASQWKLAKQEFWDMVLGLMHDPPRRLLYAGCGFDTGFREFQKRGDDFINFDLIPDMLETLMKQHQAESCVAGDMNALPFQPETFDAIIIIDVLHHESAHLPVILGALSKLLKPDGNLFIEDINAWGLYQIYKSICMPRPLYRFLRSFYHRFRHAHHAPAEYEFPTSFRKVKTVLTGLGFHSVEAHPTTAYPYVNRLGFRLYHLLGRLPGVHRRFNYHYMLSAKKSRP